MLGDYLLALSLTLLIEGAIAYLFGLRTGRELLAVALINVITHLLLNYLLGLLGFLGLDAPLLLIVGLELLIVIAEWRLLVYVFGPAQGRFLTLSFLANSTSFLVGLLLFWT